MTYDLYRSPRPHPDPNTEGTPNSTHPTILEAVDTARSIGGWHWITRSGASGLYRDAVELVAPRAAAPYRVRAGTDLAFLCEHCDLT